MTVDTPQEQIVIVYADSVPTTTRGGVLGCYY
jgi:hypothetical protein